MGYSQEVEYKKEDLAISLGNFDYSVNVEATIMHYHDDGCMYRHNGDWGDPPSDEVEVDEVTIHSASYEDENGETVLVTDKETLESIKEEVIDYLYDNFDSICEDE